MSLKILTYGTFDVFHYGHERILERASELGREFFVGVSTDAFNEVKGKKAFDCYEKRVESVRRFCPTAVIFEETSFDQKANDINRFGINYLVMGDDWKGKFDCFKDLCSVKYLSRTDGISSTMIRQNLMLRGQVSLNN